MWIKEAEEVTWDRFAESLSSIELTALADKVKEKLGQYHQQQKADRGESEKKEDDNVSTSDKQVRHYNNCCTIMSFMFTRDTYLSFRGVGANPP